MAGLLNCIGEIGREYSCVDAVICVPSELYEYFVMISRNPEKDFEKSIILHWRAGELIRLCAHRFY